MKCTDKQNCRVYPPGVSYVDGLFRKSGFRVVDVIDVWFSDYDPDTDECDAAHATRYGTTTDGVEVEVCEGHDGDWYAIEIGQDD